MLYTTLKLIHVLAVIAWVGGNIMLTLVAGRAARTEGPALAHVARIGAGLGGYFGAVSGIALLAGLGMMLTPESPWEWSEAWISIGLAVWLISAVLGARVVNPRYAQLADVAEGGDGAAVEGARKRIVPVTMVDLTLLVIAVAAMVFKWGS